MNVQKVIEQIKKEYPGEAIILDPEDSPAEIIVEIEPTDDHPSHSLALAVVGKSRPHYHNKSTEIYEAVKGTLTVYTDGKPHILKPGDKITVRPGVTHSDEGDEAWFLTHSSPGWLFEDHIVVDRAEYEINEKDIESVIRYLKIHDPDNATPEKAISMLEDMQAGFHMLEHTNPDLLDKLYDDVKRKEEN